jgi:phage/plasmid-associated DNA primase
MGALKMEYHDKIHRDKFSYHNSDFTWDPIDSETVKSDATHNSSKEAANTAAGYTGEDTSQTTKIQDVEATTTPVTTPTLAYELQQLDDIQASRGCGNIMTGKSEWDHKNFTDNYDFASQEAARFDRYKMHCKEVINLNNDIDWEDLIRFTKPYKFYRKSLWVPAFDGLHHIPLSTARDYRRYLVAKARMFTQYNSLFIMDKITPSLTKEAFENAVTDPDAVDDKAFERNKHYLAITNQVVCVEDGTINFYSPEDEEVKNIVFTYSIDAEYDEDADSTYFEEYLHHALHVPRKMKGKNKKSDAARWHFWECMAFLVFSDLEGKAIINIHGEGGSGKTRFVRGFLQRIMLPANWAVFEADIKAVISDHGSASYLNRHLLVSTEANGVQGQAEIDSKKRLSGGDDIIINPKGKAMTSESVNLHLLEICNHKPLYNPLLIDNALINRYQFLQVYPPPAIDVKNNLEDLLYANRDYFLTMCIKAMARLQKNKYRFTECKKDLKLKQSVFEDTPAKRFCEECCEYVKPSGEKEFTSFKELKNAYMRWKEENAEDCKYQDLRQELFNLGFHMGRRKIKDHDGKTHIIRGLKMLKLK